MINYLGTSKADDADKANAAWQKLSASAREVLLQMFLHGPQWDGYVCSKMGRDELRDLELIDRGYGWQWLTRAGMEVALCADWDDKRANLKRSGR